MSRPALESPSLTTSRRGLLTVALPALLFGALAVSAAWLLVAPRHAIPEGRVAHMRDLAAELSANIAASSDAGLAKTRTLASDPRVLGAIDGGDRKAAEAVANALLQESLELDVVALFDRDGSLLAVSTTDHHGNPVPRARVDRLYEMDYSGRGVIQGCLRDDTPGPLVQFQTQCDFTPALFDSTGLSVAMSVPVLHPDGSRVGVVSTRLRFDRINELVRDNSFIADGNGVYLVSDDGRFFDERINGEHAAAPISRAQATAAIRSGTDASLLFRHDNSTLLSHPVPLSSSIEGGGIHVLLQARQNWLQMGQNRGRLLAGGLLVSSLAAVLIWALYSNTRADRLRTRVELNEAQTRMSLILERVSEGVLGIDPHGRIAFANPAAAEMLGAQPDRLVSTIFADFLPAQAQSEGGHAWKNEDALLRRVDGATFHARISYIPLPDTGGAVATFSDLTDRIKNERRLLEATHLAGRAEVATSVLHNVGNVLNSINVAASVVAERLRDSEIASLVAAGELIRQHKDRLPEFLREDERGRHLPDFLIELARCLDEEQQRLLTELEGVVSGVEHVRHVVSMQQNHSKSPHLIAQVVPTELMDAAVEMQRDSLTRHGVQIDRQYQPLDARPLDKHQVLQILLNLIRNGRQAVDEIPPESRRLTLGVREEEIDGRVFTVFEVEDNGIGIRPEHMTSMFSHGFTTRRDGHGFGLHSSANSARSMGGSISVHSDGPGAGARFSLRIPLEATTPRTPAKESACTAS